MINFKFSITELFLIGGLIFSGAVMYAENENNKSKNHELQSKIELMEVNEKNMLIAQGIITQQLTDITKSIIRIESKMDKGK